MQDRGRGSWDSKHGTRRRGPALTGRADRTTDVILPGGPVGIEWADNDHVYMTGPATEVFTGEWPA